MRTWITQSCPALSSPVDCSPPGSSLHGISQARIRESVTISSSWGSSQPRDQTLVSISCICCIGRQILYHQATWGARWIVVLNGWKVDYSRMDWYWGSCYRKTPNNWGFAATSPWHSHRPSSKMSSAMYLLWMGTWYILSIFPRCWQKFHIREFSGSLTLDLSNKCDFYSPYLFHLVTILLGYINSGYAGLNSCRALSTKKKMHNLRAVTSLLFGANWGLQPGRQHRR